ncbi:MAG: 5'/3'-nucleotidase SurE [Bacteroidota bacterium]|nr:5'/3'-nucleotidase SurE [Bacteroidota bacterium]
MNANEKVILITNDDGITAPGIAMLINSVRHLGKIIVVAPDSPQSGMGHAVTISRPLRLDPVKVFEGIESYSCSGTPADCVKLAVSKVLHKKPDIVVSGINHGSNSSINVLYSGTMSAAVEAAIEGIPAIGFSFCNYSHGADMSSAGAVAAVVTKQLMENPLPSNKLLNVNIPDLPTDQLKGIKICRQAKAKWEEEFSERIDPHGRKYFWLTGKFANYDSGDDTDEAALKAGFVSIVPVQYDLTAHDVVESIKNWEQNLDKI